MFTIDDLILRRVFQPIVDWLSPWCGRFYAARCCGQIAIIALIGSPLDAARNQYWASCVACGLANAAIAPLWFGFIVRWRMQERREERGLIHHPHYVDAWRRLIYLFLVITMVVLAVLPTITAGPCAQALSFAAITAAMYLADCNPGTPRPRRVMAWAEA